MPYFAKPAKPLNKVTKKNANCDWTQDCQIAFNKVKKGFIQPTILQYPDFSKKFIPSTDASRKWVGNAVDPTFFCIPLLDGV